METSEAVRPRVGREQHLIARLCPATTWTWHNPALCIREIVRSLGLMFRFFGEAYDGHTLVFREEMADKGCRAREKEVIPDGSCSFV